MLRSHDEQLLLKLIDCRQPGRHRRLTVGEFVSGNYFQTFGLSAAAGRLLQDRDDTVGVPLTAVMSYETSKTRFNGDGRIVGSTFRVNTKPVTIVGIAPKGFYGDRVLPSPPEYYLPIETMTEIANISYVQNSRMQWLYIIGRLRPVRHPATPCSPNTGAIIDAGHVANSP